MLNLSKFSFLLVLWPLIFLFLPHSSAESFLKFPKIPLPTLDLRIEGKSALEYNSLDHELIQAGKGCLQGLTDLTNAHLASINAGFNFMVHFPLSNSYRSEFIRQFKNLPQQSQEAFFSSLETLGEAIRLDAYEYVNDRELVFYTHFLDTLFDAPENPTEELHYYCEYGGALLELSGVGSHINVLHHLDKTALMKRIAPVFDINTFSLARQTSKGLPATTRIWDTNRTNFTPSASWRGLMITPDDIPFYSPITRLRLSASVEEYLAYGQYEIFYGALPSGQAFNRNGGSKFIKNLSQSPRAQDPYLMDLNYRDALFEDSAPLLATPQNPNAFRMISDDIVGTRPGDSLLKMGEIQIGDAIVLVHYTDSFHGRTRWATYGRVININNSPGLAQTDAFLMAVGNANNPLLVEVNATFANEAFGEIFRYRPNQ